MKETSTVGGIGGFMAPMPLKSKKKKRKIMNRRKIHKKSKKISERANTLVRDTIFKIIVEGEGGDKGKHIMSMYDGIAKRLSLSFGYAKNFMVDAVKVEDVEGAMKFNLRRAKAELRHVQNQIEDMQKLIDMMYANSKQNNIVGRNDEKRKEEIARRESKHDGTH